MVSAGRKNKPGKEINSDGKVYILVEVIRKGNTEQKPERRQQAMRLSGQRASRVRTQVQISEAGECLDYLEKSKTDRRAGAEYRDRS